MKDDEEFPVLVALGRPDGKTVSAVTAVGSAMAVAFGRAARSASLAPLVAEDLLRHLHLKLHECYQVQRRMKSFFGKVHVLLTGGDPVYIQMGGSHLRQTLTLLDVRDEDGIDGYATYLLRHDVARQAHDLLGAQLEVAPETLRQGLD